MNRLILILLLLLVTCGTASALKFDPKTAMQFWGKAGIAILWDDTDTWDDSATWSDYEE